VSLLVTLDVAGDRIHVKCPPPLNQAVEQIAPTKFDFESRTWIVPATPENARNLQIGLCRQRVTCTDAFSERFPVTATPLEDLLANSVPPSPPVVPSRTKGPPHWPHQLVGYGLIAQNAGTLLWCDMGTGKTRIGVDAVTNIGDRRLNLVIAPKTIVANDVWPLNFDRYAGAPVDVVTLDMGTNVYRRMTQMAQAIRRQAQLKCTMCIIANYHAFLNPQFCALVQTVPWALMLADEVHTIKGAGAKMSRKIYFIGKHATRRVGLTGTACSHSLLDLYGQFRFLDDTVLGRSYARFKAAYAIPDQWNGAIGFRDTEDLVERIAPRTIKVAKRDVVELPPVTFEKLYIDLHATERKAYREFEQRLVLEINDGVITASNALVKLLRLQQLASGYATDDAGVTVGVIESPAKREALHELLGNIAAHEPIVVFARFHPEIDDIRDTIIAMKRPYYELSGREDSLKEWLAAKDGGVLCVQIQKGGLGIDLTKACYGVWYSPGLSRGDYEQAIARLDRPGQTRPVTFFQIIPRHTRDAITYEAFESGRDAVEMMFASLRQPKEPQGEPDGSPDVTPAQ
jgi:SNF2 family DNA or RNA helicase